MSAPSPLPASTMNLVIAPSGTCTPATGVAKLCVVSEPCSPTRWPHDLGAVTTESANRHHVLNAVRDHHCRSFAPDGNLACVVSDELA